MGRFVAAGRAGLSICANAGRWERVTPHHHSSIRLQRNRYRTPVDYCGGKLRMHAMTAGVHEGVSAGLPGPEKGISVGSAAGATLNRTDVTSRTLIDNPSKGSSIVRPRA